MLSLFVVRLASTGTAPTKSPLLMISGGPGTPASQMFLYSDKTNEKIIRQRDIYLIDQRGTGASQPFDCDVSNSSMLQPKALMHEALRCAESFEFPPQYFTTSVAVRDFERVRERLALSKWNLYGGSYGTRVAQHYMREFPDAIESVVLDGVIAPGQFLGPDIALESQAALDKLMNRCEQESECQRQFPSLRPSFERLLKQLKEAAVEVDYEDIQNSRKEQYSFRVNDLIGATRMALYQDESAALLPIFLQRAYRDNNFSALARNAKLWDERMRKVFYWGMHNSVVCTEDIPFIRSDMINIEALKKSYMGVEAWQSLEAICKSWPKGVIDEEFHSLRNSSIPTLLLSGELDPITPPSYAELAKKSLSNARHVVLKGQGHGVSGIACMPTVIAKFIDSLDPKNLDVKCLDGLKAAPIFLNANGSAP